MSYADLSQIYWNRYVRVGGERNSRLAMYYGALALMAVMENGH